MVVGSDAHISNIQKFHIFPIQCIHVFCMILRINSISYLNSIMEFLFVCGRNWVFRHLVQSKKDALCLSLILSQQLNCLSHFCEIRCRSVLESCQATADIVKIRSVTVMLNLPVLIHLCPYTVFLGWFGWNLV